MRSSKGLAPWRALRHPLWCAALAVLVVNDHLLKGAGLLPGAITGKLSDVAGLIVAPALLATLVGAHRRAALVACHVVPVLALALLKLVPGAAEAVVAAAAALGESWAIVADPTDVLASPAALLAWTVLVPRMREPHRPRRDARALVLAAAGALACGATSRMPPQSPGLGDGQVVVQAWPGYGIHRIDARTGEALGRLGPADTGWIDAPIVRDGAFWFVTDGTVRECDLATGKTRWMHLEHWTALAHVDDETILVFAACESDGCDDPRWVSIERATKRKRWSARGLGHAPPVASDGLVAHAEGPRLVVRDTKAGAILWTRTFAHDARAVAVSGGTVWVVDDDAGSLHALDARTGADLRRFALEDPTRVGRSHWTPMPTVAAMQDRLWVADDGVVRAFAANGQAPSWTHPGSGVAARDDLVVISEAENLVALDAATGRRRWKLEGLGWHRAVVGEGIVAVRQGDQFVAVHDLATGRPRFRFDLEKGGLADEARDGAGD